MQINSINCKKPRHFGNNYTNSTGQNGIKKPRYKHYEEMNDDVLCVKSMAKAHEEVNKSGKMKLFNALPAIATSLIGTSIALTQPGKLSAKAVYGLGFLAAFGVADTIAENFAERHARKKLEKNEITPQEKNTNILRNTVLGTIGITAAIGTAAAVIAKKPVGILKPVNKFLSKEINQLSSEIDTSKVGKFFNEKIAPVLDKHKIATNLAAPLTILAGDIFVTDKLAKSLDNDFIKKSLENFSAGKKIQEIAKEHYDSIDAQEV